MPTHFSVVLLTCNRAESLRRTLSAIDKQTVKPREVVVIDNGSTDNTPQVLQAFISRPWSMHVVEGNPDNGWAQARNLGVEKASDDWVVFTDDDCEPGTDWLEKIAELTYQGYDAIGGPALPPSTLRFPWWWHPDLAWAVGLSVPQERMQDEAGSIHYPATANLAVRRQVLLNQPFQNLADAALGQGDAEKTNRRYLGGREDAELWRRLRRNGYQCVFSNAPRVIHHIDPDRLRFLPVLKRAFRDGVALYRREPHETFVEWAVHDVLALPWQLSIACLTCEFPPWRTFVRNLAHGFRQWGVCGAMLRETGVVSGGLRLIGYLLGGIKQKAAGRARQLMRAMMRLWLRIKRKPRPSPLQKKDRPGQALFERRVAVAALGYIGDLVLLHPFLSALAQHRPGVEITLITNRHGRTLYENDPAIAHVVVLQPGEEHEDGNAAALELALKGHRIDLLLVPYYYGVSPAALFSRSAARVVTFDEEVGFDRRWWYDRADQRIRKPRGRHEAVNLARMFAEAGLDAPIAWNPLAISPESVEEARLAIRERGLSTRGFIVVAPGSGKSNKLWVETRWAEVVDYLTEEYHAPVVLMGSPGEMRMCHRIAEQCAQQPMVSDCDIGQAATFLGEARLLVCCDNGLKHLAAAGDTPTLTLFGPTDERQWNALWHPHRHGVVRGCTRDLTTEERVGMDENYQMRLISVGQVKAALNEMLAEY